MRNNTDTPFLIRTAIIVLLTACLSFPSTAQKLDSQYFTLSRENFVDTIKIKIWEGAVIVPVEIAGKTRNICTYKSLKRQGKLNRLLFRSPEGVEKEIDW